MSKYLSSIHRKGPSARKWKRTALDMATHMALLQNGAKDAVATIVKIHHVAGAQVSMTRWRFVPGATDLWNQLRELTQPYYDEIEKAKADKEAKEKAAAEAAKGAVQP